MNAPEEPMQIPTMVKHIDDSNKTVWDRVGVWEYPRIRRGIGGTECGNRREQ